MKYLIIVAVVLIGGAFYWMNQSNKQDAEYLKQQEIAHQQKLEQEKIDEAIASKMSAQRKAEAEKEKLAKLQQEQQMRNQQYQADQNAKIKDQEKAEKELKAFKEILNKWMTQDNIASSTSRIALSTPVTELRKIKDELNALKITGCLTNAKTQLLSAMDDEILMFVYFMQNNSSSSQMTEKLKISYANKLAEVIKQNTECSSKS